MDFLQLLHVFAPLFSATVWRSALLLATGAVLAPGRRTVTSALRVLGLSHTRQYPNFHRVLSRARWSPLAASRLLLQQLLATFAPAGPLLLVIDDTIERRWGRRIVARGIYRDPVRSSREHFVKASGLRWLSLMLLVKVPWAQRLWALPFLTALTPSERYNQQRGRRHKTLSDWARQMLFPVRRWLRDRPLILVADSSFAALELLAALAHRGIHTITRLRLDAALYEPAPPRCPGQLGRPRRKGKRLPTLAARLASPETVWQTVTVHGYGGQTQVLEVATGAAVWYHVGKPTVPLRWVLVRDPTGKQPAQGFLCTDSSQSAAQIVQWYRWRWQVEVTFEEVRAHLGVESQRQWSPRAIARTTPVLLGLFALVVLQAQRSQKEDNWKLPQTAWYRKERPTFVDALALVRRQLWAAELLRRSPGSGKLGKVRQELWECWSDLLCYAA